MLPAGQFQLLQRCAVRPDLGCGVGVGVREQIGMELVPAPIGPTSPSI